MVGMFLLNALGSKKYLIEVANQTTSDHKLKDRRVMTADSAKHNVENNTDSGSDYWGLRPWWSKLKRFKDWEGLN